MSYLPLGSRKVLAAADTTGLNTGNLTSVFDVALLGARVPYYEIYTMTVTGLIAVVATITAYLGNRIRTSARLAGNSEWDPAQPILMTSDDELYLCWDQPSSGGLQILATVWMRYDPAVQPRIGG